MLVCLYEGDTILHTTMEKWLNVNGDYVESVVYYLLPMFHVYVTVRIQLSASECLLPHFLELLWINSIQACYFTQQY